MALWDTKAIFHMCMLIFLLGGLATLISCGNNSYFTTITTNTNTHVLDRQKGPKSAPLSLAHRCDLFYGKWVHDNKSYNPLYREHECPYLEPNFACQTYGRKDFKYQQWRWQPHGCDFPRFDGKAIVEKLKGKRVLFVGDSLNRNQWNSMICMLHSLIPGEKKAESSGSMHTFRAADYNISIDFYWAPMLVECNGDSPTDHHLDEGIVRIKGIENHARDWLNADFLVFNSYHWWRRNPVVKLIESAGFLVGGPNQAYEEVDSLAAYNMALETWSKWAETHIDPLKTKLFFMGATATHTSARYWGGNGNCYNETEPVKDDEFWVGDTDWKMFSILESSLNKLRVKGVNVALINITQLTQSRKDAHTTVYRKQWRPLTELQRKRPETASDCSHWCLPGVPDIWNELLLAYIFQVAKP